MSDLKGALKSVGLLIVITFGTTLAVLFYVIETVWRNINMRKVDQWDMGFITGLFTCLAVIMLAVNNYVSAMLAAACAVGMIMLSVLTEEK